MNGRFVIPSRRARFMAYGLLGWCGEVFFTGIHDFIRNRDARLPSRTSIWMFPIYGLMAPQYERLHEALLERSVVLRAAAYGAGFLAVEYSSGVLLRRTLGDAPWDYSYAKRHVNGLIRPDYFPLWATAGLAMERVHDVLAGRAS